MESACGCGHGGGERRGGRRREESVVVTPCRAGGLAVVGENRRWPAGAFFVVVFLVAICRSLSSWGCVWRRDHRDASDRQLPRVGKKLKRIRG